VAITVAPWAASLVDKVEPNTPEAPRTRMFFDFRSDMYFSLSSTTLAKL
jgi:hypothetical protein